MIMFLFGRLTGQVVDALVGNRRLAEVNRLQVGQVLRDQQKAFVAELCES